MTCRIKNKDFVFFITNSLCVLLSNRLALLTVSWWVVKETANASGLAKMMAMALSFEVACRFLFANIGDLYNKKHVVMLTSLVTCLSSMTLFLVIFLDSYYLIVWIPIILMSVCNAIRMPVNSSMLRFIVPEYFLSRAVSINQGINTFGAMIIPILSGILVSFFGVKVGLLISTATSALSVFILTFIKYVQEPTDKKIKSFLSIHRDSWGDFLKIRLEVILAIICALLNGGMFAFFSVFVPYFASSTVDGGAWIMGVLDGAFALGLLFGAIFIINSRKFQLNPMIRITMGFVGITLTFSMVTVIVSQQNIFSSTPTVVFIISLILTIGGFCLFLINNSISIIRMHASPKLSLSSIIAFSSSISGILIPIGLFVSGYIIDAMGMYIFCISIVLMMIIATSILVFNSHTSAFRKLMEPEISGFYTKRYLKL